MQLRGKGLSRSLERRPWLSAETWREAVSQHSDFSEAVDEPRLQALPLDWASEKAATWAPVMPERHRSLSPPGFHHQAQAQLIVSCEAALSLAGTRPSILGEAACAHFCVPALPS